MTWPGTSWEGEVRGVLTEGGCGLLSRDLQDEEKLMD